MSLFHRYWWYGVIIAIAQIFSDCPVIVRCLGGTWVSWIVENALHIVMRSGVYSLLSFCNGSCQCVNNFIGFSGKTLFQLSFIILFILTVQISFLLLSIVVSLFVVHRTNVWVQINGESQIWSCFAVSVTVKNIAMNIREAAVNPRWTLSTPD